MPADHPELSSDDQREVDTLMQTQGWLAARDYLRTKGYSVADANRAVLPRRGERDAREVVEASVQPSDSTTPAWLRLLQSIECALQDLFFSSRD
jgi:hypothetical protein